MNKIQLDFMVVPELLSQLAEVKDPVRVRITDPEAIFLMGVLGESGRRLVSAGVEFYFARPLAEKLISKGIAEVVMDKEEPSPTIPAALLEKLEGAGTGLAREVASIHRGHSDPAFKFPCEIVWESALAELQVFRNGGSK